VLAENPHDEILTILDNEPISVELYPDLSERFLLEINILDQKI